MTLNFIIFYCTLFCTFIYSFSIKFSKFQPCFIHIPNTHLININSLRDDIPIEDQFSDSKNQNDGDSNALNITEDQFKAAAASAIQLSTLGIDWIKIINELKESDECAISTNTLAYNAAISSAAKNSDFDKAVQLFNEIKREDPDAVDVVTYKMLILAAELAGKYEHGILFYNDFLKCDMKSDYGVLTSVLRCCAKVGYDEYAVKVFNEIKKITDPKISDYENVIQSCIISNNTKSALIYFNELAKSALPNDLVNSISNLILHGSFNMNGKLLLTLWEIIRDREINLDKKSFIDLLNGFYNCKKFDVMEDVWDLIYKLYDEKCGNISYQIMLKRCSTIGDCIGAKKMIDDMERVYRGDMNDITFCNAIESCIVSGESKLAINFLRKSQSLGIDTTIGMINAVFKACNSSEDWEDIVLIYEQNRGILEESSGRELLEAKVYYLLANYNLGRMDLVRDVIKELSELQEYSFPFAVKVQHFVQQKLSNL